MEELKNRVLEIREKPITEEKSILDDIVLYRIEGEIPFKEQVIKQLADKGLYRFYEDEDE
jgi:hypothetical protein